MYVLLQCTSFRIAEQKEKCSKLKDINHFTNFAFTVSKVKRLSDHKTFSIQETGKIFENLFIPEQVIWRRNRSKYFSVFLYAVGTEKGLIISGRSSGSGHRIRRTWRVFPRPTPHSTTNGMWVWVWLVVWSTNVLCWFHNVIRSKKYYPEV